MRLGLLAMLALGALAGWLASAVMHSPNGLAMDIVLGVIGAFIGGIAMNLLGQTGFTGFNLYGLFVAFIGAVILIFLGRTLSGKGAV